jgi:hypothetical protein
MILARIWFVIWSGLWTALLLLGYLKVFSQWVQWRWDLARRLGQSKVRWDDIKAAGFILACGLANLVIHFVLYMRPLW